MDALNILAIAVNIIIGILVFGSVLDDIYQQKKIQRMIEQLNKTMDSHQETCDKVFKKLIKFSNNQEQINQKIKLAESIHWEAIRIIANEIHK